MKILLNTYTHGDEEVGGYVFLKAEGLFNPHKHVIEAHVANLQASERHVRFIDADLNRVFPGKIDGNYEERLAYELTPRLKEYDIVIDIHSTKTEDDINTAIVTKLDDETRKCVDALGAKRVILMEALGEKALISQAKIGIALEYGTDKGPNTRRDIIDSTQRLLDVLSGKEVPQVETKYYRGFGSLPKQSGEDVSVKNFTQIKKGDVIGKNKDNSDILAPFDFVPFLFGKANDYTDIHGWCLETIE